MHYFLPLMSHLFLQLCDATRERTPGGKRMMASPSKTQGKDLDSPFPCYLIDTLS